MDAPGCYEQAALQGSGLVRTVGPCAQRRVALMPRAIATARDALSNDRRESAARFERPAKQALALATEPRAKRERGLFIPVSSPHGPIATFEQSENVAIAHLVGAACFAKGCGLCNRFYLRMRTVLMGNLAQAGYCLCVSIFCKHVLLTDDHAC